MDSEILRYFVDPVKGKILLEINNAGSASVRYLCERCPDIPRSTMYRHLAKLEKTGLLEVVSTRRVRGTIEKTYRFVSEKFVPSGDDYSKEAVLGLFIQYWMRFYDEFERNIPDMLSRDKPIPMSFTAAPVYATDEEMKRFIESVGRMISAMAENKATDGRKAHTIGLIVTPPRDDPAGSSSDDRNDLL